MKGEDYKIAYDNLNKAQKEAVEVIDGPVMVVAGPGTGKTEVLALRIANILKKTDIGPSGVTCLTFTNAGVHAMRVRLHKYIGHASSEVNVSTFHSFATRIVEKHFEVLDMKSLPKLLDEQASIILYDEILHNNEWEHLRPRNNPSQYFYDLKSLLSVLKRENISTEDFKHEIDKDIKVLESDPESISSRGASKGSLKKEILNKIEALERTKESVKFFTLYENAKEENGLMDYDDVLKYALEIVNESEDAKSEIQENNQYILVDEHQDSSGIQNEFLTTVWGEVEKPNIFVVGDDRQLIYGFSGAHISYFEEFKHKFGVAHLVTLTENYRSTSNILDTADHLLTSHLAEGKLKSNTKDKNNIYLYECGYTRDEIILAGELFLEKIKNGTKPEECALLVPKNYQARSAIRTLLGMGLPVSGGNNNSFFDLSQTQFLKNILKIVNDPYDAVAISDVLFDQNLNISPLSVHAFLRSIKTRTLCLDSLLVYEAPYEKSDTLFANNEPIKKLGESIKTLVTFYQQNGLHDLIQAIGQEYLLDNVSDHDALVKNVEVVRTYLHLVISKIEKDPHFKLADFVLYIERLESYKHNIPLATIGGETGVRVLTLHGSKGLEFEVVHIAHLDENSLMSSKKQAFTLPEKVKNKIEEKDEQVAKRELYVAITRAKKFCTMSYALQSLTGWPLALANIVAGISEKHIIKKDWQIKNPLVYVENKENKTRVDKAELAQLVAKEYMERNVSVTLLNNFFECPWKWYFQSFLQVPGVKTESLILGTVVHYGIEQILKNLPPPRLTGTPPQAGGDKILKNIINESLDKELVRDKACRSRIEKNATKIIESWVKNYYPHVAKDYTTERSIAFTDKNFPHLKMYGKIDLTENLGDDVMVTDFKTGSSKTTGVIEKQDEDGRMSPLLRQLAMYTYLLNGNTKNINVSSSRLLFLEEDFKEKNAVYTTNITEEEIDLLVRDVRDYDNALKSGEWVHNVCNFKPYGTGSPECEHCKRAGLIYN